MKSLLIISAESALTRKLKSQFKREFSLIIQPEPERSRLPSAPRPSAVIGVAPIQEAPLRPWHRLGVETRRLGVPLILLVKGLVRHSDLELLSPDCTDFLLVPWNEAELSVRLSRAIWAGPEPHPQRLHYGPLVVDPATYSAHIEDKAIMLTRREYAILSTLMGAPQKVHSREELLLSLTQGQFQLAPKNVDVHINSLRRKLGPSSELLLSVRGIGYRLKRLA